jgi:DNA polymerase III subunit gamma/tau
MALNCEVRLEASKRLEKDFPAGAPAADGATKKAAAKRYEELARAASEPCGECESCRRIWSGSTSLDVIEIDAASNRGVDDARDLRERAMYAPSAESRWKVYIVDEAHMLTRDAWNALLKILEEPPPRVVFVFATTEPHKIAQAAAPVLSRLQRFDFKRISPADIRERLTQVLSKEGVSSEPDALTIIARAADGSMRDALSLTDQVLALGERAITTGQVREALGLVAEDEYLAVLDLIAERRAGDVFATVARLVDMGADLGQFLAGLGEMIRAQLAVVLGAAAQDVSDRAKAKLAEQAPRYAAGDLLRMLSALAELEPRFRRSTQQQLLLEMLLVRFALLDRTVAIEDMIRQASGGGSGGGGGGASATEPTPSRRATPSPREGFRASVRTDTPWSIPRIAEDTDPRTTGSERFEEERRTQPRAAGIEPATEAEEAPHVRRTASGAPAVTAALSINSIAGAWDDVVAAVRRERPMLGSMLEQCLPIALTATGVLTLQAENASTQDNIGAKLAELTAALKSQVVGLDRVVLKPADGGAASAPVRMSTESVRTELVNALRKQDPVLRAAIDALDLELID